MFLKRQHKGTEGDIMFPRAMGRMQSVATMNMMSRDSARIAVSV